MSNADALSLNLDYSGTQIRMVGTKEAPEWVASDACSILELGNTSMAVSDFPENCKGISLVDTPGGPQRMLTVSESGLYRLIAKSRKPEAERFRAFIFDEVLPSIRKFGCFPPPGAITVNSKNLERSIARAEFRDIVEEAIRPGIDSIVSRIDKTNDELNEMKEAVKSVGSGLLIVNNTLESMRPRKEPSSKDLQLHLEFMWDQYGGICQLTRMPIVYEARRLPQCEIEHAFGPHRAKLHEFWLAHKDANWKLYSDPSYRDSVKSIFDAYHVAMRSWMGSVDRGTLFSVWGKKNHA